jgi:hypothetical protein
MVRPSKSWLFLGSQARIYYPVYNDFNQTLTTPTAYDSMFDFGIWNDISSNFWLDPVTDKPFVWDAITAYTWAEIVEYNTQVYLCIQANTNVIPFWNLDYWIPTSNHDLATSAWITQNLSPISSQYLPAWILVAQKDYLIELYFDIVINLISNIKTVRVDIASSINWSILTREMDSTWSSIPVTGTDSMWWAISASFTMNNLALFNKYIYPKRSRTYLATQWETFNIIVTVEQSSWTWEFTILWWYNKSFRGANALRPNY